MMMEMDFSFNVNHLFFIKMISYMINKNLESNKINGRNDKDGVSRVCATTQLLSDSSDVTKVTYLMTSQVLNLPQIWYLGY